VKNAGNNPGSPVIVVVCSAGLRAVQFIRFTYFVFVVIIRRTHLKSLCLLWIFICKFWYGDGVDKTVEENSSIISLIRMHKRHNDFKCV